MCKRGKSHVIVGKNTLESMAKEDMQEGAVLDRQPPSQESSRASSQGAGSASGQHGEWTVISQ